MSLPFVSSPTVAMAMANVWLSVTVFVFAVIVVPETSESCTAGLKTSVCKKAWTSTTDLA